MDSQHSNDAVGVTTAAATAVELNDDLRELMREIAGFTGAMLDGVENAC